MRVAYGFVALSALSIYIGGALAMELVWRPLQRDSSPGQVGVLCDHMGRRYRWVALVALGTAGADCLMWRALSSSHRFAAMGIWPGHASASARSSVAVHAGWPVASLAAVWIAAVVVVCAMGIGFHPRSHRRQVVAAGRDAHELARRRRRRAMRIMDVLLRVEIVIALCIGALFVVVGTVASGQVP